MEINKPTNGSKYLIVFHREDNDGLFSMAIIRNHLVRELGVPEGDIEYFGANYEEMNAADVDAWLLKFGNIIMTDISFPLAKMKKLYKALGERFVWIDHHAPIIKECDENKLDDVPGSRLVDRSAILNAYEYFRNPFHLPYDDPFSDVVKPNLLVVLSAFDSFSFDKWGLPRQYVTDVNTAVTNFFNLDAKRICAFVDAYMEMLGDPGKQRTLDAMLDEFHKEGEKYNRIERARRKRIVEEFGSEFDVDGRKACALFMQGAVGSDWFESVGKIYPNGIIFKRMANGRWIVSLYNTDNADEFHCGDYLKRKYGGGGHVGAAGCQISQDEFIKILKSRKL